MTTVEHTERSEAQDTLNGLAGYRTHRQQIDRHVDHMQCSRDHLTPRHQTTHAIHYRQQYTSRQRVKYQHKLLTQVADKIYHFYSNSNIFGYHSCNMFKKTNKMDIDRQKHCKPIVCYLGNAFIAVPITIWNVVKFRLHKTIFTTTMTF